MIDTERQKELIKQLIQYDCCRCCARSLRKNFQYMAIYDYGIEIGCKCGMLTAYPKRWEAMGKIYDQLTEPEKPKSEVT